MEEILDENHLIKIRKEKLEELKKQGKNPFEITKYNRTHTSEDVKNNFTELEGKDIYLWNEVPEGILFDEINGFAPKIINGNLELVK